MMLWMYLVDPYDHVLKVLCQYLHFRLRYVSFRVNGQLEYGREEREREEREYLYENRVRP